jgi:hypothetical protein
MMMSLSVYKLIHIVGIGMIFLSMGGMSMHALVGGEKQNDWRKPAIIGHGVGMLLILVAGFGMLARLGIHWPWPTWVILKLVIWFVLGGSVALLYRSQGLNRLVWFGSLFALIAAGYLAIFKL